MTANQGLFDVERAGEDGAEIAVFAGGCFWCMEEPFDPLPGVLETIVGYTGGFVDDPTYRIVTYTETGHVEAVLVMFDPSIVSYRELLEVFWVNINPFDNTGQFCDRGTSYRSGIFVTGPRQRLDAVRSRTAIARSERFRRYDGEVATFVRAFESFWIAEEYHQDYYIKRPFNYSYYRGRCGRDDRLADLWGPEPTRIHIIRSLMTNSH